jgi:RNA recognition motif-containing protein
MLRNLKSNATEEDLTTALGSAMSMVREVRLIRDRNGTPKGFAFMEFLNLEEAVKWMDSNRNTFTVGDRPVHLEYSRQRADRDRHSRDEWMCFKVPLLRI